MKATPVLDKTELAGVYDIKLNVETGDALPQPGQPPRGFGMTPGILAAVEQLGLKLISQKGPADSLVIDHVERPSPN